MEISYLSIGGVALYNGIAHYTLRIWTKTETIEKVYDYAMHVHKPTEYLCISLLLGPREGGEIGAGFHCLHMCFIIIMVEFHQYCGPSI